MITKWAVGNNVRHTLFAGITAVDTSVILNLAAPPFRSVAAPVSKSDGFRGVITLTDSLNNPTKIEVVTFSTWVDNGDGTITLGGLVRGEESTVASSFSAGNIAYQGLTSDGMNSPLFGIDSDAQCVFADGAGDYGVPAVRVGSGGIRSVAPSPSSNTTVIECAEPGHGPGNGFFRLVAGVDGLQLYVPPPTDSSLDGPTAGVMEVNWLSYPPSFDKSLVSFKNIRATRIEGIKASRYAVNVGDSLASNVTIDWSEHDIRRMPLASNSAITHSDTSQLYPNDDKYRKLTLIVEIPNVPNPGYTVTQSANVKIPAGVSAPTFNTGQNQIRVLSYLYDGTWFLYQGMQTYQL